MNHQSHLTKLLSVVFFFLYNLSVQAQPPMERELDDPTPCNKEAWQQMKDIRFEWGSTDVRYSRSEVPTLPATNRLTLHGWRGERRSAQAVLVAPLDIQRVTIRVSDLRCGRNSIPADQVRRYFVCYTLADKDTQRQDSILVADRLDPTSFMAVDGQTVRPIWLDIRIPRDAAPGMYSGTLSADCDGQVLSLPFRVEVASRTLPQPADWKFHLDLWQNPYAVARYYQVPLWSQQHFDLMRPVMTMLAEAGAKVITTSIIQHPWNSQTEDPFESMITKMKTIEGTWRYDYTVFDRWVQFMMDCGITRQIDCYTLVPWHYRFDYFDLATNSVHYVECKPGEAEYEDFILPFLRDFAQHLKEKGWFDRTCIAMDERPMQQLQAAYDIVRRADPGYRIEGAFNYFPAITSLVHDVSISFESELLSDSVLKERRAGGHPVTFYTCCGPTRPNTFTFSPPAEAAYMGWHAVASGYDGYLRWAYNSWVKAPCQDSRFRTWASGDCFLVYPGQSSIRIERLVQGIQDFEKVHILLDELQGKKRQTLLQTLIPFRSNKITEKDDIGTMILQAEDILRKLE